MAINRSWNADYLHEQHKAIKWLAEQGITLEEIREMRWGQIDESEKTLSVSKRVVALQYDRKTGLVKRDEYDKNIKILLKGTKCEDFFLKSRIYCAWMFTRELPTSWRKDRSKNSLYSLSVIRGICGKVATPVSTINALTKIESFANIEVSKVNITKMKTKELGGVVVEI